jgi:hypothetical protein
MSTLPNGDRAVLDIRKLEEYCLDPAHPRGRHKARVFVAALGVRKEHADWLRALLLEAARDNDAIELAADAYGRRWSIDMTVSRQGRDNISLDREDRRSAAFRNLLGSLMVTRSKKEIPALLDVVALTAEVPPEGLARGQVGTVVELLDENAVLVEFSDDEGRAYAVAPCQRSGLLVLHYTPEAA